MKPKKRWECQVCLVQPAYHLILNFEFFSQFWSKNTRLRFFSHRLSQKGGKPSDMTAHLLDQKLFIQ